MNKIINEAYNKGIKELSADVSLAAEGFFEKFGFKIVKRKTVDIRGEKLDNALMRMKFEADRKDYYIM